MSERRKEESEIENERMSNYCLYMYNEVIQCKCTSHVYIHAWQFVVVIFKKCEI